MKFDTPQYKALLELIIHARVESLGCDGCASLLDQFAQAELDGEPLLPDLQAVSDHIQSCKCCRDEYEALLAALEAIAE